MSRFESVFAELLAQGDPYKNEYGWTGRMVDIGPIVVANSQLITAQLGFAAHQFAGIAVAYPADTEPTDTKHPRIVETITFTPDLARYYPNSMTTIVGANPLAKQRVGKGMSHKSKAQGQRVLEFVLEALDIKNAA